MIILVNYYIISNQWYARIVMKVRKDTIIYLALIWIHLKQPFSSWQSLSFIQFSTVSVSVVISGGISVDCSVFTTSFEVGSISQVIIGTSLPLLHLERPVALGLKHNFIRATIVNFEKLNIFQMKTCSQHHNWLEIYFQLLSKRHFQHCRSLGIKICIKCVSTLHYHFRLNF